MQCAVAVWARASALALITVMLCTFTAHRTGAQTGVPCRYEISAIIPGPFCEGWGNAPMFARGLSNHNPPWVAGFYSECTIGPEQAFVWIGSGLAQPLQFPGAGIEGSFAFDVTDTGLVVGAFAQSGQPYLGFIYDVATGEWTQLNSAVPGGGVVIRAANNDGMVVGSRNSAGEGYSAFIYQNGVYTDLGVMNGPNSEASDIAEDGTVVGWTGTTSSSNNARAFIHRDGRTTIIDPPLGGFSIAANSINESGWVGLHARIPNSDGPGIVARAALWIDGRMTFLQPLPSFKGSFIGAIGNDGTVVGQCRVLITGQNAEKACIWRNGEVADLNTMVPPDSGMILTGSLAINDSGQILCEASLQGEHVGVVLTPVLAPVADITLDCRVGVPDLLCVINEWGQAKSIADINQDDTVNIVDLMLVIEHWADSS